VSEEEAHVVSYRTYILVWIGLLILTTVTILAAQVDLGAWNIWLALGIATVKSALVVLFFMHMKYEHWLLRLFFLGALATLAIFIGLNFFDILYRYE